MNHPDFGTMLLMPKFTASERGIVMTASFTARAPLCPSLVRVRRIWPSLFTMSRSTSSPKRVACPAFIAWPIIRPSTRPFAIAGRTASLQLTSETMISNGVVAAAGFCGTAAGGG
ncbi:MAG TPA: hypothetical protein VJK04_04055, partial [Candidatus Paceibacterota bacterium]